MHRLTRRRALSTATGALSVALVPLRPDRARATPELLGAARAEILKGRTPRHERIRLEAPELAENGNSVTITIEVDSPMSEADHVVALHVLAERNPLANVVSMRLGPRAGRAQVATTIRLADSQHITALAELSTGEVLEATAGVVVTIAACIDAG